MARLVADARVLAAALPAEELDARALTAVKGLIAAAVALPEHSAFLTRALRVLPQELNRQVLPDGCHCERSPAQQLAVLMDLVEIRALLQAAQAPPPEPLARAIERMGPALRLMRHGDGGLALFNGTREEAPARIEAVLAQAGRAGRMPSQLAEGGFHRLQTGRTVLIMDCGAPAAPKLDRCAHAGTLAFEGTGLRVTAAPTPLQRPLRLSVTDFLPSVASWQVAYFVAHEWVGLLWYGWRR